MLNSILDLLAMIPIESLQVKFIQRAIILLLILSPMCAFMGVLVTNFRMVFFSDAVAHSAFCGIAIGLLLGVDPWISVTLLAVFMGYLTIRLRRSTDMTMDTTLGVMLSTMVAFGLAIVSAKKSLGQSLPSFLYGDVLSVENQDIIIAALLFVAMFIFIWFSFNRLIFVGLHEHLAVASGISPEKMEIGFSILLAVLIAFSIKAVGILLVTALLVIPPAAAANVCSSLQTQVLLTIVISMLSCFGGIFASIYFDITAGSGIILLASCWFFCTLLYKKMI